MIHMRGQEAQMVVYFPSVHNQIVLRLAKAYIQIRAKQSPLPVASNPPIELRSTDTTSSGECDQEG